MMLHHLKSSSCQGRPSTITQIVIIGLKYIQNSVNLPYSSVCTEITIFFFLLICCSSDWSFNH